MSAGHSHAQAHGHIHAHGHGHVQASAANARRLRIVLVLVLAYMVAEVIGGLYTNSLALLADAGHMLSDAGALALSLFALWIGRRPATSTHTYGFYRTEILAALVNGAALVAISIYIFAEAIRRFGSPPEIEGGWMMVVAAGGLAVNLIGLAILSAGRSDNLNIRGAWLHVLSDTIGSVGTLAAGGLILAFGWRWADPVASVLIGILVLYSSWSLLKETVAVLMEGAPGDIDVDEVRNALRSIPGVESAHDLHVWTITSGMVAMSAHVIASQPDGSGPLLERIRKMLHERFGIHHITVQVEPADFGECCVEGEMHA